MQIYIFFLFRKNKSDTICTMAYISMFFLLGLSPQRWRRRAPVGSIFLSISKNSPTISHFHPPGSGIGSHRLRACSLPAPYLLRAAPYPLRRK